MKRISSAILLVSALFVSVAFAEPSAQSIGISVDCNNGQSLARTLAKLDRHVAATVSVNGTCTEYVPVIGFENLTLKGNSGAALVQPITSAGNLFNAVLLIEASRTVIVDGFSVQADPSISAAVAIAHGSSDIRLRNLKVQGGTFGINVIERSQASLAYVNVKDPGYGGLGIFDSSDVHVEHCFLTNSSGALWHAGIHLGASHLTMYATTIRNMQAGIYTGDASIVDLQTFNTYFPITGSTNVVIENLTGTGYNAVTVAGGSTFNVYAAGLTIDKPGQWWGGTTGGILVDERSLLTAASSNLLISGSHAHGIVLQNSSFATLTGASITGSGHGGLVLNNLSSVHVAGGNSTLVGGNAIDLFCDSNSTIIGGANLAGVPTSQCSNVQPGEFIVP